MPLEDLITAVSVTPARVIGQAETLGSLQSGRAADLTVLQLEDVPGLSSTDCAGVERRLERIVRPRYVVRDGVLMTVKENK